MKFTAKQIAGFINGKVDGDKSATVNTLAKIEEGEEGAISFLANPKYQHFIYETKSSIVIVNKDFVAEKPLTTTIIRVDDAYASFAKVINAYDEAKKSSLKGISPNAFIHKSAKIGKNAYVGDFAYVGANSVIGKDAKIYPNSYVGINVKIGDNVLMHPGVKIMDECVIGHNCTFQAGAVIGSDGFGFAPQQSKNYERVAQIGNVIIEDNVDIGANTTVDRATMGSTIIRKGVKLDNLIQVAHNVEIGENTVMASQTGISGSSKIGENCMFGGQVGIAGHLKIADGVKLAAKSGVASDIPKENNVLMGAPAFEHKPFLQAYVYFRKLPELNKKISKLESKIKELELKNGK
jgi:UDP-3-O-[3-hydroxymyristoyl] glucosamine N-acyltransferase